MISLQKILSDINNIKRDIEAMITGVPVTDKKQAYQAGHYYEINITALRKVDATLAQKLTKEFLSKDVFEKMSDKLYGGDANYEFATAVISYFKATNKIIMWAPNRKFLLPGLARHGRTATNKFGWKADRPEEKFKIALCADYLEDLGHWTESFGNNNSSTPGYAKGKIEVMARVNWFFDKYKN
jgi:hypothetical protein